MPRRRVASSRRRSRRGLRPQRPRHACCRAGLRSSREHERPQPRHRADRPSITLGPSISDSTKREPRSRGGTDEIGGVQPVHTAGNRVSARHTTIPTEHERHRDENAGEHHRPRPASVQPGAERRRQLDTEQIAIETPKRKEKTPEVALQADVAEPLGAQVDEQRADRHCRRARRRSRRRRSGTTSSR